MKLKTILCVFTFKYMYFRCFCMCVETMRVNQGEEFILQFLMNMAHNHFMFLQFSNFIYLFLVPVNV